MAIAISAVATTNTSSTSTAPAAEAVCCANVTRLKFTPFNISSMHISMTSTLRRTITPSNPSANSAAEVASSIWTLSTVSPSSLEHGGCRDHGGDQQHRHELEVQPVFVQECDREALHAENRARGRGDGHRRRAPDGIREDCHEQSRGSDRRNEQ